MQNHNLYNTNMFIITIDNFFFHQIYNKNYSILRLFKKNICRVKCGRTEKPMKFKKTCFLLYGGDYRKAGGLITGNYSYISIDSAAAADSYLFLLLQVLTC